MWSEWDAEAEPYHNGQQDQRACVCDTRNHAYVRKLILIKPIASAHYLFRIEQLSSKRLPNEEADATP